MDSARMSAHRVRVGVARYDDGWNVVIRIDGRTSVYDPTFATEQEALAKADEVAAMWRDAAGQVGLVADGK